MIGPIVIIIAIVVFIPVSIMMSGAAVSGIMGWLLKDDAEDRYEGSELVDLNR